VYECEDCSGRIRESTPEPETDDLEDSEEEEVAVQPGTSGIAKDIPVIDLVDSEDDEAGKSAFSDPPEEEERRKEAEKLDRLTQYDLPSLNGSDSESEDEEKIPSVPREPSPSVRSVRRDEEQRPPLAQADSKSTFLSCEGEEDRPRWKRKKSTERKSTGGGRGLRRPRRQVEEDEEDDAGSRHCKVRKGSSDEGALDLASYGGSPNPILIDSDHDSDWTL